MNKFVFQEQLEVKKRNLPVSVPVPVPVTVTQPEGNWYQEKWKGAIVKEERQVPKYKSRTIALSGPLDGRMHEKMINHNKSLKLSGPIDGRMNERMMMYTNRSPLVSKPLERRFTAPRSPRVSGPLDMMVENRTPRLARPSDATKAENENLMGYSPYNKPKDDFDYDEDDDDHTLWPTLFQDLKPT